MNNVCFHNLLQLLAALKMVVRPQIMTYISMLRYGQLIAGSTPKPLSRKIRPVKYLCDFRFISDEPYKNYEMSEVTNTGSLPFTIVTEPCL